MCDCPRPRPRISTSCGSASASAGLSVCGGLTTNIPLADFQAATKDPIAAGVPDWWFNRRDGKQAAKSIEGFLFPQTYEFNPGVTADQLTLVFSRGTLLVSGVKKPKACGHADAAFHLAERAFGRFTRAFRIAGAVDAGAARATLAAGELRILVPRIADRRGREIRIAVEST